MKPRNEHERRVVALSAKLPEITDKARRWAESHCFDKVGLYMNGEVWCTHCGALIPHDATTLHVMYTVTEITCPICGAKLVLRQSRKKMLDDRMYFTVMARVKEFQVLRHYSVDRYMRRDGSQPIYEVDEAVQIWMTEQGRETIIARPCKPIMMYCDVWDFRKPMEVRDPRNRYGYGGDKYNIAGTIYPWGGVLPILRRNGYRGNVGRLSPRELFKMLLKDNEAEMLLKTGQMDLLYLKWKRSYRMTPYAHAIKIANRNKYFVRDATMWIDYLELLDHFGLDTHNAHYVCPKDLKGAHDRLLARKRKEDAKRRAEERMREAERWEAEYREKKDIYFGIVFGNEHITVSVVQSVADMAEEGAKMRHCVYENGYYKKDDSLILSARDHDGNRIETIEVSLKTYDVVQSRGVCNKNTEWHNEIVNLVRSNMHLIRGVA